MAPRPGGATLAAAALALTLALAATALAWSRPTLEDRHPVDVKVAASGAMRIADSRGEGAILRAPALAPGSSIVGALRIESLGAPAFLELSLRHVVETPGLDASLAAALRLRIREVSGDSRELVYQGLLAAMPTLRLGSLPSGAARRYRFVARLPEPGFADNGLTGARLRFDYLWRLRRQ